MRGLVGEGVGWVSCWVGEWFGGCMYVWVCEWMGRLVHICGWMRWLVGGCAYVCVCVLEGGGVLGECVLACLYKFMHVPYLI